MASQLRPFRIEDGQAGRPGGGEVMTERGKLPQSALNYSRSFFPLAIHGKGSQRSDVYTRLQWSSLVARAIQKYSIYYVCWMERSHSQWKSCCATKRIAVRINADCTTYAYINWLYWCTLNKATMLSWIRSKVICVAFSLAYLYVLVSSPREPWSDAENSVWLHQSDQKKSVVLSSQITFTGQFSSLVNSNNVGFTWT